MRCQRLLLTEMIRDVIHKVHLSQPAVFQDGIYLARLSTSTKNLQDIQADIMASVPQYMGYLTMFKETDGGYRFPWSFFQSRVYDPFHSIATTTYELPMVRTTGGTNIIWAVYFAGATDIATEPD